MLASGYEVSEGTCIPWVDVGCRDVTCPSAVEGEGVTLGAARNTVRKTARRVGRNTLLTSALRVPAQMKLLPWALLVRIPIQREFHVKVPGGSGYQYVSVEHDRLGRRIFWIGFPQYEPETLPLFARVASRSDCIVDVGANTGIYSLTALSVNPNAQVTAIEAVGCVAERLSANLNANGWDHRCRIVAAAASDSVGSVSFAVQRRELPDTSRLASISSGSRVDLVEVPMVTVDELMPPYPPVDLVKLDVEGAEDKVLGGMTRIIREDRPVIFTEALTFESDHLERVTCILSKAGYRFWRISNAGALEQPRILADPTRVERNYLCVPDERVKALRNTVGAGL